LYLFLAHMNSGFWIRLFEFTVYGQKDIWVVYYTLYHG